MRHKSTEFLPIVDKYDKYEFKYIITVLFENGIQRRQRRKGERIVSSRHLKKTEVHWMRKNGEGGGLNERNGCFEAIAFHANHIAEVTV